MCSHAPSNVDALALNPMLCITMQPKGCHLLRFENASVALKLR